MTTIEATAQRDMALAKANAVRKGRKELKRRIYAREIAVRDIVLTNAPETATMTVSSLLMAQRSWSHVKTHRFLKSVVMSEWLTVGELTDRQREMVAERLEYGY